MLGQETSMVSNEKQSNIFTETFNKLFKENKESSMFDRFSSLDAKEKMLAVTAVGVIFGALLPVVAVALPVAAAGAAVALTLFFAVKAVEYGYKGLKWSAEKTWEGAKRVGGKIRDGVVYIKGKAKKGASTAADRLGDSLKRAAHGDEYSMESEFVQESLERRGIRKVVNDTINHVKANDSSVPSVIKSAIKSAIDSKIGELGSADKGNLEKQRKIVDRLEEILTKSPLDTKELSLITEVFSQYQSEVKGILDDYAQNPGNYPKPPTLPQRMSNSLSSSFSSLRRKSPDNLSRSSSMSSLNSNSTDGSTAGLVNPEEHKKAPTFKNKMSSLFRRNKAPKEAKEATEVKYQPLPEPGAMQFAKMGNSTFYVAPQKPPRSNSPNHVSTDDSTPSKPPKRQSAADWIKANGQQQSLATVDPTRLRRNSSSSSLPVLTTDVLPKAPESPTSSRDSGINSPNPSGSSTPTERQSLSMKDVEGGNPQAKLRRTNSPYKPEQPSTHMSEQKHTPVNRRLEILV